MHGVLPALGLISFVLTAPAGAGPATDLRGYSLDNGLTVVVIEDHRAPVVTQMIWYRVGSADDPAGQAGAAHFLEHLMFKATDKLAEGEFARTVEENGGTFNAFTSIDHTAFIARVAADRLDLVMAMEADRMANLAPTEASVLSERDVVIEERRQVVDGDPGGAFGEQMRAAAYPNSPHGRPTIGSEREIAGLTRENAMEFYRAHYAPNNAILVVAGDVNEDEVRRLAERHFGAIPASALVQRSERPHMPPVLSARRIEVIDARIAMPQVTRAYLAPQRRAGDQKEAAALVVLADILGGERVTSVLARALVGADGIALAAGTDYSATGLSEQLFSLSVVSKPGVDPAVAEAALEAVIARFLDQGPDPDEIERIRGRVHAGNIYMLDDVAERASRVGEALTSGLTLEDVEAWPDLLESVTVEDIKAVANEIFHTENSLTGWLMPQDIGAQEPLK